MKFLLFLLFSFSYLNSYSQIIHANLYGGIANYQGDLQSKRIDLNQSRPTFGIGLSYEINSKLTVRGIASYIALAGRDDTTIAFKNGVYRNLNFKSTVWEAQLALEYNFLDIQERGFTPYVFAGIAAFHFNPYSFDSSGNKVYLRSLNTEGQGLSQYPEKTLYKNNQIALPFGVGIKLALSDKIQAGLEFGFRKIFTDYLDDVSGTYADSALLASARSPQSAAFAYRGNEIPGVAGYPAGGSKRGNPENKDWYITTVLRITYLFGSNRTSSNIYSKKSKIGCPTNVY